MRIHAVHVQGLRAPEGVHRVAFDGGWDLVVAPRPEDALALAELVCLLLYPDQGIERVAQWVDLAPTRPPRAGLSIAFGSDVFRLILDVERGRLLLGQFDEKSDSYRRVSTDPSEIAARLRTAGLPAREDFLSLHFLAPVAAAPPEAEAEADTRPALVVQVTENVEAIRDRAKALRQARDRFVRLETDLKQVVSEIEQRSVLADVIDDIDDRLERYRELLAERALSLDRIEHSRRAELEERSRLHAVPASQVTTIWIGGALAAAGAVVAALVEPIFGLVGVLGVVMVAAGSLASRAARYRLQRLEGRLAALRVRERAAERQFESEGVSVRSVLRAMDLESSDELQREVADYRGLLRRAEGLRQELQGSRRAFPEDAELELADLGRRLEACDRGPAEPSMSEESEPPTLPIAGPVAAATPEGLLVSAQRAAGCPEEEVHDRLGSVLPLYLRAFTAGAYTQGSGLDQGQWCLRAVRGGDPSDFADLSDLMQQRVLLALRFALLESLASDLRVPLVIGADLRTSCSDYVEAVARGLRRLGAVLAIVHVTAEAEPWVSHAGSVHHLSR